MKNFPRPVFLITSRLGIDGEEIIYLTARFWLQKVNVIGNTHL